MWTHRGEEKSKRHPRAEAQVAHRPTTWQRATPPLHPYEMRRCHHALSRRNAHTPRGRGGSSWRQPRERVGAALHITGLPLRPTLSYRVGFRPTLGTSRGFARWWTRTPYCVLRTLYCGERRPANAAKTARGNIRWKGGGSGAARGGSAPPRPPPSTSASSTAPSCASSPTTRAR